MVKFAWVLVTYVKNLKQGLQCLFVDLFCQLAFCKILDEEGHEQVLLYIIGGQNNVMKQRQQKWKKKNDASFTQTCLRKWSWVIEQGVVSSIYILDSSNSSSFTFWYSLFASSCRSNWTGIWTSNSNGTWTDKQSCHFSTAKEIRVKATFFFM